MITPADQATITAAARDIVGRCGGRHLALDTWQTSIGRNWLCAETRGAPVDDMQAVSFGLSPETDPTEAMAFFHQEIHRLRPA
jgi:hypothetical protein